MFNYFYSLFSQPLKKDKKKCLEDLNLSENAKKTTSSQELPFVMQVANNPKVDNVHYGKKAMMLAGAQSEFIAANILQAQGLGVAVILRAGDPPQYNKHRSPKSGVNLTKTSNHGFFKGTLAKEERFARLSENRTPYPHHAKDAANLCLNPIDLDYQHTMPLDINMQDILREISVKGDLEVLGFNLTTGFLRLGYKKSHGPKPDLFDGQFIINLYNGLEISQFYVRDWDRPENDLNWDSEKEIIRKPVALMQLPDELYEKIFNQTFMLGYAEDKMSDPDLSFIKEARVFANRPRYANDFKQAMGAHHPQFGLIKACGTLFEILDILKSTLGNEKANQMIADIYQRSGSIVTGDWDGMALGHPPSLDQRFSEMINTFAPGEVGLANQKLLLERANLYVQQIKANALDKLAKKESISSFEDKMLSLSTVTELISPSALVMAGCITAHEFVFQQVLNSAYKDKANTHYGEKYNEAIVQKVMDALIGKTDHLSKKDRLALIKQQLTRACVNAPGALAFIDELSQHLVAHLAIAAQQGATHYTLPHFQHDKNVHDLYQHGFEMRNPYGSHLEGAWLLITADGGVLYGSSQKQLIEVLLTGDFLKKNCIDINHDADWASGWDRVIARQIELGQVVPEETLCQYRAYVKNKIDACVNFEKNYLGTTGEQSPLQALSIMKNKKPLVPQQVEYTGGYKYDG